MFVGPRRLSPAGRLCVGCAPGVCCSAIPASTRSVCREARGLQALTPLLLHWQKSKNSTFGPLSSEEQVASERFPIGIKIPVLNLGKCEIIPETGDISGKLLGSPLDKINPIFQKLKALHSDAPPFFPREENDVIRATLPSSTMWSVRIRHAHQGAAQAPGGPSRRQK